MGSQFYSVLFRGMISIPCWYPLIGSYSHFISQYFSSSDCKWVSLIPWIWWHFYWWFVWILDFLLFISSSLLPNFILHPIISIDWITFFSLFHQFWLSLGFTNDSLNLMKILLIIFLVWFHLILMHSQSNNEASFVVSSLSYFLRFYFLPQFHWFYKRLINDTRNFFFWAFYTVFMPIWKRLKGFYGTNYDLFFGILFGRDKIMLLLQCFFFRFYWVRRCFLFFLYRVFTGFRRVTGRLLEARGGRSVAQREQ